MGLGVGAGDPDDSTIVIHTQLDASGIESGWHNVQSKFMDGYRRMQAETQTWAQSHVNAHRMMSTSFNNAMTQQVAAASYAAAAITKNLQAIPGAAHGKPHRLRMGLDV